MKKFIYFTLILIFCFGLSTTVFGAKSWSKAEFETFMEYMGYGEIDLDEYTFSGTNGTKTAFESELSSSSYGLIILKVNNSNKDGFSDSKFIVFFPQTSSSTEFYLTTINGEEAYRLETPGGNLGYEAPWIIDTNAKTAWYSSSGTYYHYVSYLWYKDSNNVTEEEWTSTAYKTHIFEQACIFSDETIIGTTYIPQGGRVLSSEFDSVIYKGSISYGNTTKTASITYTSGFETGTTYDLFLERYMLNETFENGIGEYPVEIIDLGDVTTVDTSLKINIDNFALGSMCVYRLCVGKNTFDESGKNEVFICTDWLLPNDNTLGRYPTFSRSHYVQFLGLVGYDPNYSDPIEPPENPPSVDDEFAVSGLLKVPSFLNSIKYTYDINDPYHDLYILVNYDIDTYYDISNYHMMISKYNASGEFCGRVSLADNYFSEENYDVENWLYDIYLPDYYEFSTEYFYYLNLYTIRGSLVDVTGPFFFDSNLKEIATIIDGSNNSPTEEAEKNLFQRIFDSILEIPLAILNGLKNFFVPGDGFFSAYFEELNTWFGDRLGILYFPFDFVVSFFNRIYTTEFGEPIIEIPAIQIPLFEEYGNIYDGTTFNFNDFINQNEIFKEIYNLYLIAIDGVIIFGLARLLFKKYEEVTTNGD